VFCGIPPTIPYPMKHRSKRARSEDSGVLQIQTQATTSGRDESLLNWDPVPSSQYEFCAMNDGQETSVQECKGSACGVVKDTAVDSTPAGETESSSGQSAPLAIRCASVIVLEGRSLSYPPFLGGRVVGITKWG
jgi:hypothetical protein